MSQTNDADRLLSNLQDEQNSAALYRALAAVEKDPQIAQVYRRLGAVEQGHADTWIEQLRSAGVKVPPFRPTWRTRLLIGLARRFGAGVALPSIATLEQVASHKYNQQADAAAMIPQEQSHARLLREITWTAKGGMQGGALAQIEGRHRSAGGNALRAAVLGASDGLLSNLSLVMGVAGANLAGNQILITGLAGMLAGSFSMALGEWLSVQSSRELYQKQISIETAEIAAAPEEEAEELALIYQARGLDEARARQVAARIMSDKAGSIETLAREELGIDTKELGGSAREAAITSFLLFAAGAIVPVIPFTFLGGTTVVMVSVILSLMGLFVIGAVTTLFTGRSVAYAGTRQVVFGLAAAAITFIIGRWLGVSLAG
jgi:VIT1/CCC1 family predicted Fe2+/Mn2+ transporter